MFNETQKVAALAGAAAIGALGAYFLLNPVTGSPENSTPKTDERKKSLSTSIEEKYQDTPKTPSVLREKGNEYFKAKKYKKAIEVYTEALNLAIFNQNDTTRSTTSNSSSAATFTSKTEIAKIYNNLSACYEYQKEFADSVIFCMKCLENDPSYKKAWGRLEKLILRDEVKIDPFEHMVILMAISMSAGVENTSKEVQEAFEKLIHGMVADSTKMEFHSRVVGTFPRVSYVEQVLASFTTFDDEPFFKELKKIQSKEQMTEMYLELEHKSKLDETGDNFLDQTGDNSLNESKLDSKLDQSTYKHKLNPDDLLIRGTLHLFRCQYKLALVDFESTTKHKNSDDSQKLYALIQMAVCHTQDYQIELGQLRYAAAEQLKPENSDLFYHRAQLQLGLGRLQTAIEYFEKAIKFNPDHALAQAYLTTVKFQFFSYHANGDASIIEGIADEFAEKISRFPGNAEIFAQYGNFELHRKNFDQAISLYDKCYEVDGSNANALCQKASAFIHGGKVVEGLTLLTDIVRDIDDECSYAYEIMARIAKMQGNLDAETDSLAKAIESSRDYREIFEYFISYYSAKARQEVQSRFGLKAR
jgi:import receptor subunit TOM70